MTSRYPDENGPDWPYSDEFTAGVEHQLMNDFRVGVMYYHRTNRKVVGQRNVRVPLSAYTEHTIAVPAAPTGPGGTITFFNLNPAFQGQAFQDNVFDNDDLLDTVFPKTKRKRAIKPTESLISIDKAREVLGYKPKYDWRKKAKG